MGRAAVTGIVGLVAGFVLGLGVRGCAAEAPGVGPAPGRAKDVSAEVPRTPPREPPTRVRAPIGPATVVSEDALPVPATAVPPATGTVPDVREIPFPGAPTGWADLVVEFCHADGSAVRGGQGFHVSASDARRAGPQPWAVGDDDARTDETGRAHFRVASPGRYDVWTTCGMAWVVARDVVVPATSVVRLVRPPEADVQLTLEDAAAVEGDVQIGIVAAPDQEVELGRGVVIPVAGSRWGMKLSANRSSIVAQSLVAVLRWRIDVSAGFAAAPSDLRPPAEVVVRRAPGATPVGSVLHVQWRVGTSGHASLVDRRIRWDWRIDGGSANSESVGFGADDWADGGGLYFHDLQVHSPSGVLRWSGGDVEPGSLSFDLAASDTVQPVLRVQHSASAVLRVDVDPAHGPVPPTVPVAVWDPRDDGDDAERGTLVPGVDATMPAAPRWVVVVPGTDGGGDHDDLIGGPVALRGGGHCVLRYTRGRFVVIAPRGRVPTDAGAVEIARADGGPLVQCETGSEPSVGAFAVVAAGTIVGPFEPGTVTLDVLIGRVRWARYEVTIRAGEHTPLPIGPFPR